MTFFTPLSISIIVIGVVVMTTPLNVHAITICKKTTLYPLTFPPQREHVTLCHPVGKTLTAANNANLQFNSGILAAQNSNTDKCPTGHTEDYCDGWNYQKRWG